MTSSVLAVDPGLEGAFAFLTSEGALHIRDMPVTFSPSGKRIVDLAGVVKLLRSARAGTDTAAVEQVGGMPGQSGPAAFSFGHGAGAIAGAALALGYRLEFVQPARWKAVMKCPANKTLARARASEVFPDHAHLWTLAKHDGRAEASLLAAYALRVFGEEIVTDGPR